MFIKRREKVPFVSINSQFWIKRAANCADYSGAIVSYACLAAPLFAGLFAPLTDRQLGALISRNSFITIV